MNETLRVAVFGATGVAGTGVVSALLAEPRVERIVAFTRRSLERTDDKLEEVACDDFGDVDALAPGLEGVDAVCFCLGVSATQVDSEATYRLITHDYALAAGRALVQASPDATFHFLSGAGTDADSRRMWARVKGETENALAELPIGGGVVCWRPGMILAPRPPAGLPFAYKIAYPIARMLSFVPSLSIRHEALGQAMLQAIFEGQRDRKIENREIRQLADKYRAHRDHEG